MSFNGWTAAAAAAAGVAAAALAADRTAAAAERRALKVAVQARVKSRSTKKTYFAIDNLGVAKDFRKVLLGQERKDKVLHIFWHEIRQMIPNDHNYEVVWMPSHGKHLRWEPPTSSQHDKATWRMLNDRADAA